MASSSVLRGGVELGLTPIRSLEVNVHPIFEGESVGPQVLATVASEGRLSTLERDRLLVLLGGLFGDLGVGGIFGILHGGVRAGDHERSDRPEVLVIELDARNRGEPRELLHWQRLLTGLECLERRAVGHAARDRDRTCHTHAEPIQWQVGAT